MVLVSGVIILGAGLSIFSILTYFLNFDLNDKQIQASFVEQKRVEQIQSHYIEYPEGKLHYTTLSDTQAPVKPVLLLLHGSPGGWANWVDLLAKSTILDKFYVLAVDRPGYAKTTIKRSHSLARESQFLRPIIEKYCQGCIAMGHSYGGALALQLAADYGGRIHGVISLAGTVAASYQAPRWYNYAVHYSPLRWTISKALKNSNREMRMLSSNLRELYPRLENFPNTIILIQGKKDVLVRYESASFLASKLSKLKIQVELYEDMGHLMIWKEDKMPIIEAALDKVQGEWASHEK